MSLDPAALARHARRNRVQSILLLGTMAVFLAVLGWLLWGEAGIIFLLGLGVVAAFFNPAVSPRLVMRLYGAHALRPDEVPALWSAVEQLARRAGLRSVPRLYYLPSRMLNAFAVGSREQSALAITDGLVRGLAFDELVAVLAHEISHVRANDLWVMGLADLFSRATSLLSLLGQFLLLLNLPLVLLDRVTIDWGAIGLLILAPNIAALAQLALSRTREHSADLGAAELTGDPRALIRALQRIEQVQGDWMERIFMPGRRVPEPSLLRTHPPLDERVARLRELLPGRRWQRLPDLATAGAEHGLRGAAVRRRPRWHANGLWH